MAGSAATETQNWTPAVPKHMAQAQNHPKPLRNYPETIRNSTFGVDTPLPPPHFGIPKSTGSMTHPLSPQAPCPFMITLELSGNYTEFHVRGEDSLRTFIIVYRISKLIHTFWSQEDDFS